jgi:hypothetical protein
MSDSALEGLSSPNDLFIIIGIGCAIFILLVILFILYLRGKRWSSKSLDNEMPDKPKRMTLIQTIAAGTRSSPRSPPREPLSNSLFHTNPGKASPSKIISPLSATATMPPSLYAKTAPMSSPIDSKKELPSPSSPKASKETPLKMYAREI